MEIQEFGQDDKIEKRSFSIPINEWDKCKIILDNIGYSFLSYSYYEGRVYITCDLTDEFLVLAKLTFNIINT